MTPHRQGPPLYAEALFARSYRSSSFFRYRPVKLDRQAATSSGVPVRVLACSGSRAPAFGKDPRLTELAELIHAEATALKE